MDWSSFFYKKNFSPKIKEAPSKELGICIVIPCFNEPNLYDSLKSIANCEPPTCKVEVIVVVNHPEGSNNEVAQRSLQALTIVDKANRCLGGKKLTFYAISAFNLPKKHAGVGFARQIGMDEAAYRLLSVSKSNGIIACFDADSKCMPNYLVELYRLWEKHPKTHACSIRFEHPIEGNEFSNDIYDAIVEYELHLRYYNLASRFIGFPFAFHTVGSSMACSSEAYVKFGGMNRRQAGEDFYFLQKIIPHGQFQELNSTCIYPSPRISNRVPFGTGKVMAERVGGNKPILTYNLDSFLELESFFNEAGTLFNANDEQTTRFIEKQPKSLKHFLTQCNAISIFNNIRANTSTAKSFKKRFFLWFDGFMLLKYLNFASANYHDKQPIVAEANRLLGKIDAKACTKVDAREILTKFRGLNRKKYEIRL